MTKHKILKIFVFLLFIAIYHMRYAICESAAQENNKLVALSKQIIESKNNAELYAPFEELKDLYFKEHKYSELIEFLGSLSQKKETLAPFVDYYRALSRYHQLKHLEETQNWDEYFNKGNTYRDEFATAIQKTIDSIMLKEPLYLYAKLTLWQFHRDQQDAFAESSLSDLMDSALEYAKDTQNAKPIKDVADKFSSYGEKGKSRELYQIYVQKLIGLVKEDKELENIALEFYKEENLELSKGFYDAYIERIAKTYPKEKSIPILTDIAKKFSYKDEGPSDTYYAEKIFAKIEEVGSKSAFDEELIYLRAFNIEKIKDYPKAGDFYLDLLQRYPQTKYADEANFKVGIISIYVFRDIKTGRDYFEKLAHSTSSLDFARDDPERVKRVEGSLSANPELVEGLAQKETLSPQVISSLYQLGLLNQWEEDLVKAKEYYDKLIKRAKDDFQETVTLTKERLKEIDEAKPIEYNLKTFLDVSLKEEYMMLDMSKLDLKTQPYRTKKEDNVNITSQIYLAESGCFHVELQYLWSGHIGTTKPSSFEASFNTKYLHSGTKEINLVVVSPTGIVDRDIVMADVY